MSFHFFEVWITNLVKAQILVDLFSWRSSITPVTSNREWCKIDSIFLWTDKSSSSKWGLANDFQILSNGDFVKIDCSFLIIPLLFAFYRIWSFYQRLILILKAGLNVFEVRHFELECHWNTMIDEYAYSFLLFLPRLFIG